MIQPIEGAIDPTMIVRIGTQLQTISWLPPLARRESLGGIIVVRHPVALLFRGGVLSGAWISISQKEPIAVEQIDAYVAAAIPVLGKGHRVELAIHSALVALEVELRQACEISSDNDKSKLAVAHEAIDRWLLARRPKDSPLDAQGASYGTPRTGRRKPKSTPN